MRQATQHTRQPIIACLVASFVVILLFTGLEFLERARFRETLQTQTINNLSQIRARLETEINANFYLTRGLIAYLSTNPVINEQILRRLTRQILKNHNYIRNIAIAPDNIINFVYPLKGNEKAIGLEYKKNAAQWPSVARIIKSGKTVIAGPVHLVQGGIAFISRTPVYIAASSENEAQNRYWGLVSVVIDKDRLFRAAGLYLTDPNLNIAIRGKDGLGTDGDVIEGDPAVFEQSPVLLPVNLPEGNWVLAALPKSGWDMPSPHLFQLRIAAIVTTLLLGLGTFYWLRRQEHIRMSLETAWLEAKKAQNDLRLNEEFLNTVFDNLPAMIFVKDAKDLRFVRFNKTGAELLGYSVTDFLGKNDFDLFPASEATFFTNKDREVLQKGTLLDIPQEPIQTKMLDQKILHTRKIPILAPNGEPIYLLGISEDITEKLQADAKREQLEKQLQQAQKLETIGKMAGGVAHDLNNILSGIVNYPELLLMQLPQDSPMRKPLTEIHKSGKRAAKVVADLLTIARGVAATRENVRLQSLVEEHLDSPEHRKLCTLFPHVSTEVQFQPDLWTMSCSPVHIQKCLMNLINNAAEAFPADQTGKILISCRNEELTEPLPGFSDLVAGRFVVLSVTDNGAGISPNDLDQIFEPFYTRKIMGRSGTGLGLTVVWNTMKDHQGAVTVESSSGIGTTFSLYLPATNQSITTHPTATVVEELYGQGQHILVVDDEPQQRDIAARILKMLCYSVETAASGEDAIQYLQNHPTDLIVLDMIMEPGLSGRETYEKIISTHPGQKAIVASGFAEHEDIISIQALGAGQYVKKPYTLEQLGSAVQRALL